MRGDWVRVGRDIAEELSRMLAERTPDQSVRLTLAELLARSGADQEPDGYRTRSYWAQCQLGDRYWTTLRDAGLVLSFHPDERGEEVQWVTFRLDRMRT